MSLDAFGAMGAYALAQSMPPRETAPAPKPAPPAAGTELAVASAPDRLATTQPEVSHLRRDFNALRDFAAAHKPAPGDLGAVSGILTATIGVTSGIASLFPQTHDLAYGLAALASVTGMGSALGDYAQHKIDTAAREAADKANGTASALLPNERLAHMSVLSGVIEGVLGTAAGVAEIASSNPHYGLILAMGAGATALTDGVLDVVDHVKNHGGFHHFPHTGTEALDAISTCASGIADAVESVLYTMPGGLLIGGTAELLQYGVHALDRFAHREPGEPLFRQPQRPAIAEETTKVIPPPA